jgi:hypothetical protein
MSFCQAAAWGRGQDTSFWGPALCLLFDGDVRQPQEELHVCLVARCVACCSGCAVDTLYLAPSSSFWFDTVSCAFWHCRAHYITVGVSRVEPHQTTC